MKVQCILLKTATSEKEGNYVSVLLSASEERKQIEIVPLGLKENNKCKLNAN